MKALLTALAAMTIDVLAVPHIPGSPIACVVTHPACHTNSQMTWLAVLVLIVPFIVLNLLGTNKRTRGGRR